MENASPPLPFEVGGLAEARSFQLGFRGAWFRCKIRGIDKRKGYTWHQLEYYDFPDEKVKWTKLYQVPIYSGKGKERPRQLMIRPCYPPIYNEEQMPDLKVESEVAVIVDNSWKVGDFVDWWTTDCYWSGQIIDLLGDGRATMELKQPPLGEGLVYEILLKDIRPSLDWSPESGWTLPTQDNGCSCARLIKPANHVTGGRQTVGTGDASPETVDIHSASNGIEAGHTSSSMRALSSRASSNSIAFSDDVKSMETKDTQRQYSEPLISKEMRDVHGSSTSSKFGQTPAEVTEEDLKPGSPMKKSKVSEGVPLHSMHSNTLEAAVLDLEEFVNKVKWLKRILEYGVSSSDALSPRWNFLEPGASS